MSRHVDSYVCIITILTTNTSWKKNNTYETYTGPAKKVFIFKIQTFFFSRKSTIPPSKGSQSLIGLPISVYNSAGIHR